MPAIEIISSARKLCALPKLHISPISLQKVYLLPMLTDTYSVFSVPVTSLGSLVIGNDEGETPNTLYSLEPQQKSPLVPFLIPAILFDLCLVEQRKRHQFVFKKQPSKSNATNTPHVI
jgi:hypothetical protein